MESTAACPCCCNGWRRRGPTSPACRSSRAPTSAFPKRRWRRPATAPSGMARRAGTGSPSWRAAASPRRPGAACLAIHRICTAAISRRRSRACWSAAFTCPTAIPGRGPSSTTSSSGWRASRLWRRSWSGSTRRWCWPAIIMSSRPTPTPTSPNAGSRTPYSLPKPRRPMRACSKQGWTDALRKLHPKERIFTFWDYFRNAWPRDAGIRIDHLLLNKPAAQAPQGGRRRPQRPRPAQGQRPCAGLDRAQ